MQTGLDYYATAARMTSPGDFAALFDALPREVTGLRRLVQGLILHVFWAERYGVDVPEARKAELQLRSVARQVQRIIELEASPLSQPRPPERRLLGNCRDFSVMLVAMLRHHGIPARARCGFARYFQPGFHEDHWVCEVWSVEEQRWKLVDAQLDALQCAALGIPFDPLDVPRDQFILAARAWQMCRSGQADPNTFGIGTLRGLWFIRGNLIRDLAALNKVELLPWDCWGLIEGEDAALAPEDRALLDHLADLIAQDDPSFDAVTRLYQQDLRLRVPRLIRSYIDSGVQIIDLAEV